MTYTISISDRQLGYFPSELLRKLKVKGRGRVVVCEEGGRWVIRPIRNILDFAGTAKVKAPKDFDFRKFMEENYNEVGRL